jgi:hypothetical protein
LVEPEPKRVNVWPIALLLLFLGTAGWAYYLHRTTRSYPEFFNNLVSTSRQSLQGKASLPEQNPSSDKSELEGSKNESAKAQSSDGSEGLQPAAGDSEVAPSTATTGIGQSGSADGTGEASPPPTNEVPPTIGAPPSSQPVTTVQPPAAAPTERSPFSPVGNDEQSNGSTSAQLQNKPVRQGPLVVDGFTKKNVPELLRVAEIAAQRKDYRLARYEYNLILKLDHNNARARMGLRLAQEAERLR